MANLPVSCLCSVYEKTSRDEFINSLYSLFISDDLPSQIVIVIDGPITFDINKIIENIKYNCEFNLVKLKKNIGLGGALKEGLNFCKNEIVIRFDTDDISLLNRLKVQYQFLKENKDISVTSSPIFESDNILHGRNLILKNIPLSFTKIKNSIIYRNPVNHPASAFRKSHIKKIGSYESIMYFEDYFLWLKLLKNGFKIKNTSNPLVLMKRKSISERREGLDYIKKEWQFYKLCIQQSYLNKSTLFFWLIRLIYRLLPTKMQNFLFFSPWRGRGNYIPKKFLDNLFKSRKIIKNNLNK